MREYPQVIGNGVETLKNWANQVVEMRLDDLGDFDKLPEMYMRGRKVNKVPSASNDITGDRPGDFNYDASYLYICLDNSGTIVWRRAALAAW